MSSPQDEMEMMKKIIQLFNDSFNSKDNQKILEATKELQGLSQNFIQHFEILLKILRLDEKEVSIDIKKSTAVYLKNLTQSKLKEFSKEDLASILHSLITLVIDSNLTQKTNSTLENIINNLIFTIINTDQIFSNPELLQQILEFLSSTLIKSKIEVYISTAKSALNLINTFLATKSVNKDNLQITIKYIISCTDDIFSKVPNYIIPAQSSFEVEFIALIKTVYEIFNSLFRKIKNYIGNEQYSLLLFDKYAQFSYELLTLSISNVTTNGEDNVVYYTDNSKVNGRVNSMKSKAFQFLTRIIETYKEELVNEKMILLSTKLTKIIMNSIDYTIKNKKLSLFTQEIDINDAKNQNDLVNQNEFNTLIFSMLAFLTRALIREPIKTQFTPLLNNFLLNFLFPLIVPPPEDLHMIQVDGNDYYLFISDIIEEQNYKNYRAASAFLLKKLCNKYVDTYCYVISLCLQILEYFLITGGDANKSNNLSDSKEFRLFFESKKLNPSIYMLDAEQLVQFCLMILLILSENVKNNKQFKATLKKILLTYGNQLNNVGSLLIKDKLCLIYDTYIPVLFEEPSAEGLSFASSTFDFLINLILNSKNYEGLSFQATQSLLNLVEEESLYISLITDVINAKFNNLISLIDETEVDNYFEFLNKIISDVQIQDKNALMNSLSRVVTRLKREILANNTQYIEKNFQILINFLRGVNSFSEKPNEIAENSKKFQEMILPLVNYIKNPKKIEFEEEIILLVDEYLKATKNVDEACTLLLPYLNLVCQKNEMILEEVFNFLLDFMKYDTLNNSSRFVTQYLKEIIQIIINPNENGYHDLYSSKYALLLSIKLITLNVTNLLTEIDLQTLIKIATSSAIEISEGIEDISDFDPEMLMGLSLSVIGSSLIFHPEITYKILEESDKTTFFFQRVNYCFSLRKFYVDLFKCVILGFCSLLRNANTFNNLVKNDKIVVVLTIFLRLLWKQKEEETKSMKKLIESETNCNFIGEDSDDEDDFEESQKTKKYFKHEDEDYQENKDIIKKCEIGFENVDEFNEFVVCLKNIETQNPKIIENFVTSLHPNEQYVLKELTHIRKIQVQYNNQTLNIPRRTVKIKRSQSAQN